MSAIPIKIIYLKNFFKIWPTMNFIPVNKWTHHTENAKDLLIKIKKYISSTEFKDYAGD